jgi:hemoglobin
MSPEPRQQTSIQPGVASVSDPIVFNPKAQTLYDQVGGDPTFRRLTDTFYARIEHDPLLRPIFPPDLGPGKEGQFLFLTQFWGGPARYQEQRGHPALRMRHAPFRIGQAERDAWVGHMLATIDEVGIPEPARSQMREYFEKGATFLINAR